MKDLVSPIEEQLQGERASALGEAGRRLETALAAVAELGDREDTLDEAATAAWNYIILRESVHMFDHKQALAIYQVPARVMARIGVMKRVP